MNDPGGSRRSIDEILIEARAGLDRVDPADLESERSAGALIVDIRPVEQRTRDGELAGAVVIDRNVLEWRLDPASDHRIAEVDDYDIRIVIVCNEGYQSSLAAAQLQEIGLHRATDVAGGFQALLALGADAAIDIDALLALETDVWRALVNGDRDADARLLADDFLGVYPTGFSGKVEHADQLAGGPTVRNFSLSDARMLVISESAVLLAYRAEYQRVGADPPTEAMYVSSLWCRRDGRWLNVFSQDTPDTGEAVV